MNDKDLHIIEQYYRGELTEAEINAFEQRKAEDQVFLEETILHEKTLMAIRLQGRKLLKESLAKRPKGNSRKKWYFYYRFYILGFIFIVVTGILFLIIKPSSLAIKKTIPNSVETKGSPIDQNKNAIIDTTENTPNENLNPENHGSPPLNKTVNKDSLFAVYFRPYTDEVIENTVVRGEKTAENSTIKIFFSEYQKGNYEMVLSLFDSLTSKLKNSEIVLIAKANSQMELNRFKPAEETLSTLILNKDSSFGTEAKWYLSLCNLKLGKITEALNYLKEIVSSGNSAPHYSDAKKLLAQLQK